MAYDACERCGRVEELVTLRHRNGTPRELCESCAADAEHGGPAFWRWFHYGT